MKRKGIAPHNLRKAIEKLKNSRLITITCLGRGPFLELNYHFCALGEVITFWLRISKEDARVESIADLFPSASIYEREIYEEWGVKFVGNKELKKLFLSERRCTRR